MLVREKEQIQMDGGKRWTESDKNRGRSREFSVESGMGSYQGLKNRPLCLAVYSGRDLTGLPSTDSHWGDQE